MTARPSPTLLRFGLAFAALGVAFAGALLVMAGQGLGWALIALGLPLSGVLALAGDALGPQFARVFSERLADLLAQTRPWMALVALYAALKIPVPLWPEGFPVLGLASTVALCLAALAFVWERAGGVRAGLMLAVAFLVGLGVEVLGSRTGFPFGAYSYATAPAPTLLGVPLMVPLGWFALTLTATCLSGGRPWLAGLLMMLWDIGLEPLMTAQRYWLWHDPLGLWAGAPVQNFLGWWAVGTGIAWVFTGLAPRLFGLRTPEWAWALPWWARAFPESREPRLSLLPGRGRRAPDFRVAYPIEAFFLPGGLVLVGRPLEAAVTLVAMGAGLALARRVTRHDR
ncbi:carotenoid biosynthesis protein [Deinococcus multiflagellatus]|uniref:Carotenoid biosynthesis protein n=1 Tax=Deinococcus multiflagellatus TaxID=1656887 RepID=A0ABW1ZJG4_9DEIO|nr:carotenoid biosynthesis protein [Deinococcus multiflagellatus]MBZ9712377.1 carotenoid biosynthesis protein [Deinococcus multiflagellatus]